jgi:hypothetical protein
MARSLRYHPLFDSDVLNAAEWYDGRQPILGSDFVVRVRRAVDQLIADPERRTSIDYGVRYWPVQRFPYVVFYDLLESAYEQCLAHELSRNRIAFQLQHPLPVQYQDFL